MAADPCPVASIPRPCPLRLCPASASSSACLLALPLPLTTTTNTAAASRSNSSSTPRPVALPVAVPPPTAFHSRRLSPSSRPIQPSSGPHPSARHRYALLPRRPRDPRLAPPGSFSPSSSASPSLTLKPQIINASPRSFSPKTPSRPGAHVFHVFLWRRPRHRPPRGGRLRALSQGQDKVRLRNWPPALPQLRKGHARVLSALGIHGSPPRPEPRASCQRPSSTARVLARRRRGPG